MRTALVALLMVGPSIAGETGTVRFEPVGDQSNVPERFRLAARSFDYELTPVRDLPVSGMTISALTFPSPVTTPVPENNTVYAEYYRPNGNGPFPAVIVLDITGGDQSLSRNISRVLAQNRVAALFVQMAYYPPRRPPNSRLRLLSLNFSHTIAAATQTVLDCRFAAAWLASRPDIDAKRVGILGTSLGSFIATLTGEMDDRISRVAIVLGGGGLVDAFYDHPLALQYRKPFEAVGGTKQHVKDLIAPVDPITSAANLRNRKVLMVAASRDEVVPPSATRALWQELGKPKIVWYDTTHYGAAFFIPSALGHVLELFAAD